MCVCSVICAKTNTQTSQKCPCQHSEPSSMANAMASSFPMLKILIYILETQGKALAVLYPFLGSIMLHLLFPVLMLLNLQALSEDVVVPVTCLSHLHSFPRRFPLFGWTAVQN